MREQLRLLIELQQTDLKLQVTEKKLQEIPAKLQSMRDDVGQVVALLDKERQQLSDVQAYKGQLDDEISTDNDQLGKAKTKLAQVKTSKEYMAIQREFETTRRLVGDREEESLKLMQAIDSFQSSIATHETELQALEQQVKEEEEESQAGLGELEELAKQQRAEREAKVADIQASVLRKYENIRKVRGVAVVPAESGVCTGCRMQLPPQLYNILQRGASIEQCPNCHRIVYYALEDAEEEVSTSAKEAKEAAGTPASV